MIARPELIERVAAELAQVSVEPLDAEDFERAENREIFKLMQAAEGAWGVPEFVEQLPDALRSQWTRLAQAVAEMPALPADEAVKDMVDTVLRLRAARVRRSLGELQQLLAEAQEAGEEAAARDYTSLAQERTREIGQLQMILARRTLAGKREQAGSSPH
jgi:hypothetical protein